MDSTLQRQLDGIETALSTLIDTISSYNPSIPAAQTLLTADDELQQGLKQLQTHQKNHARIQQLRSTIDRQNEQITSTLQTLADTRAELLAIPTSLPPKDRRNVHSSELLDFARHISRYTVPSNFKPAAASAPEGIEGTAPDNEGAMGGIALGALLEEEKRWLDPWTGVQFTPWPSEEVIRSSALARMQAGENLGAITMDLKDEVAQQADDRMQIDAPGSGEQKGEMQGSRQVAIKKEEKPKVFGGLDLYDPDADD